MPTSDNHGHEPGRDCPLCPRLVAYRLEQRKLHPDWFNAPVPVFGTQDARLLIAGLAPGVAGANRTGRPFTGDYAGELLYGTLIGMTAYIAKLKWRDYTARDLEAAALEKKRDMLQRMRPVPGGRFSMGFVDMQTPLNQHSN